MQNNFRNLSLITFISIAIVFVAACGIYHTAINKRIIESARQESLIAAQVLKTVIQENSIVLPDLKQIKLKDFSKGPGFQLLDRLVREYTNGFGVLRIDLLAPDGTTLYSTDMRVMGKMNALVNSYNKNANNPVISEIVSHDHFYTINGATLYRDAVLSHVPIKLSDASKATSTISVYVDVTGQLNIFNTSKDSVYLYLGIVLLGLAVVMLLLFKIIGRTLSLRSNEIEKQKHELERFTYRDMLTGLPNRTLFNDRLERAMHWACQYERLLAVLNIDIDGLKNVNETYGFSIGNELLRLIAERLKNCVHDFDTVSRLDGGNFAIVLEDMAVVDEAEEVADRILEVMAEPFSMREQDVFITISVGIALYPFDDEHPETLLQKSYSAMRIAKDAGRNKFCFYNTEKRRQVITRFTLENDLRGAFERGEFHLFYQPVVQISSGEIIGVEALLRWERPSHGIVPPLEFISVLEESGLVIQVGQWVLETSCAQAAAWREQGVGDYKINVNLSTKQFRHSDLLQQVDDAIESSGLPPNLLNLEITESLLIENKDRVIKMLDRLNENGISMSVDDFGTGYSSMAYLKNMPIETIKIDKTFVDGIPDNLDDVAIIHAIDYLTKKLRLNVIAEGVETKQQLDFLNTLNIYAIQGYLVSRPLPASEFENFINHYNPVLLKN